MVRTVFFSFHYQRDILRVQIIKNHHITKGNYTAAGFFDGSLEEKAQKEGDEAVKRLIDKGLNGSTVLCVLIGNETFKRRWVDYEILKAAELGMGIFGIRIHQLAAGKAGQDAAGRIPFNYLGYSESGQELQPMIKYDTGWKNARHLVKISRSAASYLPAAGGLNLGNIFRVYDWVDNDGYTNFGTWVEAAAKQAQL